MKKKEKKHVRNLKVYIWVDGDYMNFPSHIYDGTIDGLKEYLKEWV